MRPVHRLTRRAALVAALAAAAVALPAGAASAKPITCESLAWSIERNMVAAGQMMVQGHWSMANHFIDNANDAIRMLSFRSSLGYC